MNTAVVCSSAALLTNAIAVLNPSTARSEIDKSYTYWPPLAQYAPFLELHAGVFFPENRDFDHDSIMLYDSDEYQR